MLKKHFILFIFAVFVQLTGFAQSNFYAVDSIREIRIYFYAPDWDYQLDSLYVEGDNERILADLIIDGSPYDSVGVRYKGFSSVSVNRIKNPFNIKLDYIIDGQDHNGVDKLKLSNVIQDPSFVREVLTYEIAANYLPSAKANYANVFVNDTLWGLYTNVQAVNKDFLNDHFGNKYNPFFKCNPENLNVSPGGENANLSNTNGTDSLDYQPYYDIESDYGWEALYNLIDTLNNYTDSINNVLNVDRTLWMHALNYTLINFDSYIGYGQNYYLYKDKTGQFNPLLWDLNMSFGSFRLTDASSIYFNGFDIAQAQNMDPLLHYTQISVAPRPLLRNLFLSERNRKMYLAHIRTIVNENFANQDYALRGQHFQNLINTSVQNDTNKFYTYADFITNLNNPVTLVTADCPGITQLMDARTTYLSSYTGFSGEPTITNIVTSPQNFVVGDDVWITADITDATEAILGYRFGDNMAFKTTAMFDDGNHNDGLANDGVYGAKISNSANVVDYYLYADNDSAGVFSPVRAAYEFYSIQSQLQIGDVVINELMSNNESEVTDASGKFEDWIELYNTTSSPVSMAGLFLTDTLGLLHKWELPNQTIPANGYAIIWADEDGGQGDMHANFKLSNLGEQLILTNADSLVLDSITYQTQADDVAYARSPNGAGPFVMQSPTFKADNDFINAITERQELIKVYPNPFSDFIKWKNLEKVEVRDILGQLVYTAENINRISTSNWVSGIYFIHLKDKNQTIKVIKIQ
ncbi:MAG: T9SS type A sorting domain-containing protein [Flavobacteriales bacterium]|nr:T9SS type A sorting domain-containing protein [Flavobacteriales bacterium]